MAHVTLKLMRSLLVVLALVLGSGPACTKYHYIPAPPVTASAPAKVAFRADQVVLRLEEFQTFIIDQATSGQIPTPTARIIVKWTVAAVTTIGQTPNGWQPTVLTGWHLIRDEVAKLPQSAQWVGVIDALLGGVA